MIPRAKHHLCYHFVSRKAHTVPPHLSLSCARESYFLSSKALGTYVCNNVIDNIRLFQCLEGWNLNNVLLPPARSPSLDLLKWGVPGHRHPNKACSFSHRCCCDPSFPETEWPPIC